jgi:hypothetical protein
VTAANRPTSGAPTVDPIFAALATTRAAWDAIGAHDEDAPDADAEGKRLSEAFNDAARALSGTKPTSIKGAIATLRYLAEAEEDGVLDANPLLLRNRSPARRECGPRDLGPCVKIGSGHRDSPSRKPRQRPSNRGWEKRNRVGIIVCG